MSRRSNNKRTKVDSKIVVGILATIVILVLIAVGANPETIKTISEITGININLEQNIAQNNTISSEKTTKQETTKQIVFY